jgi:hypothetical protein
MKRFFTITALTIVASGALGLGSSAAFAAGEGSKTPANEFCPGENSGGRIEHAQAPDLLEHLQFACEQGNR